MLCFRYNAASIRVTFVSSNNNKMVDSIGPFNIQICLSVSSKLVGSEIIPTHFPQPLTLTFASPILPLGIGSRFSLNHSSHPSTFLPLLNVEHKDHNMFLLPSLIAILSSSFPLTEGGGYHPHSFNHITHSFLSHQRFPIIERIGRKVIS